MYSDRDSDTISIEHWRSLRKDREPHRERLFREARSLVDDAYQNPVEVAVSLYARLDGLERRTLDPLAAVEAQIARMGVDELELLNQRLEDIGLRMVERAAELRAQLKE